jgi:hypothetical protein
MGCRREQGIPRLNEESTDCGPVVCLSILVFFCVDQRGLRDQRLPFDRSTEPAKPLSGSFRAVGAGRIR